MATFTYTSKTGMFVDDFETDHEAVDVYGLLGAVKTVSVGIGALKHGYAYDIDLLLVVPGNRNLVVMSDVGGPQNVSNASFTISNAGATAIGNSNGAWTLYMHDDGNKDFAASRPGAS